jgi:hypothetical protein
LTDVAGVPEIVGGWFVPPPVVLTVIENGASETFFEPSVTAIVMFAYVPTLDAVGVPLRRPVAALNVVHAGRFTMLKRSGSP